MSCTKKWPHHKQSLAGELLLSVKGSGLRPTCSTPCQQCCALTSVQTRVHNVSLAMLQTHISTDCPPDTAFHGSRLACSSSALHAQWCCAEPTVLMFAGLLCPRFSTGAGVSSSDALIQEHYAKEVSNSVGPVSPPPRCLGFRV